MVTVTATIQENSLTPYLERRALVHQKVLRKLFVAIYFKGEDPNQAYNRLAAAYGIFAAEINSIRKETEAIYSGWQELLDLRIAEQEGKIRSLEDKLKACSKKSIIQGKVHQWKRKLYRYRLKLESLKQERASGKPSICFGSKKLFHKQFNLKVNGYRNHADWHHDWLAARGRAFYLAGRARERSGNDACIMEVLDASNVALTCLLKLRKKNDEIAGSRAKPGDFIPIVVKFTYNHQYLLAALEEKRPIVIERLDFKQLQKELKNRGLNRLLSRFKYGLFHKLLYGRAAKYGVEIIEVNPACSSIIGWLKFGYSYGLSRHQAAALAIGRRLIRPTTGKSFSERIRARLTPGHPGARQLSRTASTKPVRKRTEHDWTGWGRLRKLLARDPSQSGVSGPRSRQAASCQEAQKQGQRPLSFGASRDPR